MNYYKFTVESSNEKQEKINVSKFEIEIQKLIDIYNKEIEYYYEFCFGKLDDDAPRHDEFRAISKIKKELENALINKSDIEFENSDYIWSFSGRLILNGEFNSVDCLECNKNFGKDEVKIEKWSIGESLFASGGRTMTCPKSHFLYSIMEWNS